jgi:methionine-rich copper-binding protein CopC
MAFSFRRRGTVLAITATTAVVGSYFAAIASAAALTGTGVGSDPVATNGFVQANRPSFFATYSDNITSASTITVKQGSTTIDCPAAITGNKIICTPSSDLINNDQYTVTSHGVSAVDGTTADQGPTNFTDAHSTFSKGVPAPPQGSVVPPSSGTTTLKATFANADSSEGISTTKSTFVVYPFTNGQRGAAVQGTLTFTASTSSALGPGPTDTMQFAAALSPGEYEEVLHAVAADGNNVDAPGSFDNEDFTFFVTNAAPQSLAAPPIANNQNDTAFPFSGTASPGLTITVHVTDSSTGIPPVSGPGTKDGTVVVPTCSSAPQCPWTAKVDVSGLAEGSLTWTAQGQDGNATKTPATTGPVVTKDTTAPTVGTVTAAPPSPNANTANVTATSSDTDVASYQVTMTDDDGNKIGPFTFAAVNNNLPSTSISLDGLDDGGVTTSFTATDKAGNVSAAKNAAKFTKNVGLKPDLTLSNVTTKAGAVTFAQVATHSLQPPTQVTLHFSEPITPQWQDNSNNPAGNGPVHSSTMCFKDSHGNCIQGAITFPADNHSMQASLPANLASGSYTMTATAWPKNFCSDVSFGGSVNSSCTNGEFSGTITKADGSTLVFNVDNTAPTAPTITVTPSPTIDGAIDSNGKPHAADVAIAGTAEPGSSVTVKVKSSGGSTLLIANPSGNPATADSNGNWSLTGVNLTPLVDGVLTVTATATDAAGNASALGSPSPAPTLAARPTAPQHFAAAVDTTSVTLSWGAPVGNGGQAINGYTLTYTDTTAGTPAQTAHPTTSPYAVTGLITGDTYQFALCATNAVSGPCNTATLTAIPRNATVLSALISRSTISYGTRITLSGKLTSKSSGAPLASEAVTITPRFDNGSHGTAIHTTTSSSGAWSISMTPSKDALYGVAFAGDKVNAPAAASVRSFVRERVTIGVRSRSSSHTTSVTISGSAGPSQAGRVIYIYEHTSRGNRLVGRARLSSRSTYALSHLFSRGTHTVFAEFFAQNGNATGVSHSVRFTRS